MRVLMISKACIVGIYQRKLEYIAQQNVDLLCVVPPSWKDERGETPLERAYTEGYRLETLPIRFNGNFHLHFYAGLGRVLREFQPHIVHIDEEPYNLAAWQAMYHARKAEASTLFFSWQNLNRRYPPPFGWGEGWMLDNVDYALVGTESAGDIWREKGYDGPMTTIPQFGTDPDLFYPAETEPQRPFTFGYIGRLVEEKGVKLLVEAFARLPGEPHLHFLGSGPLRDDLERLAQHHNVHERVKFTAWVNSVEMPPYYHQLDVMVLPSLTRPNWKEQFGRVLVEAMASGVPVVGSDSGAIPDVVGDGGIIVPENDVDALAATLKRLLDDHQLRQRLARQGRQRVLDHFTHQRVAAETVRVYRTMLDLDDNSFSL